MNLLSRNETFCAASQIHVHVFIVVTSLQHEFFCGGAHGSRASDVCQKNVVQRQSVFQGQRPEGGRSHQARICGAYTKRERLHYGWDVSDNQLYCREVYVDGDAVNTHLENVKPLLARLLDGPAELLRIELHGPSQELNKINKEGLNPEASFVNPTTTCTASQNHSKSRRPCVH